MFVKLMDETEDLRREFNISYSELEEFVKLDRAEIEELREINAKYKQEMEWLEIEIMTEYGIEKDDLYDDEFSCRICQENLDSECDCDDENDRWISEYAKRLRKINDRYIIEVEWYGDVVKEIWMRCCMVK